MGIDGAVIVAVMGGRVGVLMIVAVIVAAAAILVAFSACALAAIVMLWL